MERQFNARQSPRSMYLSIFNGFRVIRYLSQCVNVKIAIFTTFLFPLGTPLGQSRKTLHKWKDNSVLAKPIAACPYLYSTVSQLFEPQLQKIAVFTYRSPHFCFPWRCPWPCDYHAICCMDGKTIQCLPKTSQHVPCGSGIMTVNSPSGSTLQCGRWLWSDMPLNPPKRPPYWTSTSGFDFDHITAVDMSFCTSLQNFI